MRNTDEFDSQIDGQMNIVDLYEPPEQLFAVHRIFARARKEMNLAEQKTFVYALSQFRFTEEAQSNYARLDKKVLAKILGLRSDPDHLSVVLYDKIKDITKHSYVEIRKEDIGLFANGFIVASIVSFKNMIRLRFNEDFLPLFTNLSGNYITMWSSDIFQMKSERSVRFYEELRQLTDSRLDVNQHGWGIRQLKQMFNIPKDGKGAYMRKDGHFDRSAFEKRIIDPLCEDLKNCKMINLVVQPDGKYYEKVKRGGRVDGYRFYWTFSAYPGVATAGEVAEIQERVDKDPRVLKVAKDIVKGEQRKNRTGAGNQFNNFEQNSYDFEQLEREILDN